MSAVRYLLAHFLPIAVLLVIAGCGGRDSSEPRIVYITATFGPSDPVFVPDATPEQPPAVAFNLSPVPQRVTDPTPNPTRFAVSANEAREHIVQPGDTLFGIALAYGLSLNALLAVNDLADPNTLFIGQVIQLPDLPDSLTPGFKLIPDGRLVRGPGTGQFNIQAFVSQQPGYIRVAADEVPTRQENGSELRRTYSAADVVERVALEYSVDPRLLLVLLEYRAGWLTQLNLPENMMTHPLISAADSAGVDRSGLYRQLAWAANMLNAGYYGWKERGWTTLEFSGGERLLYAPGLNAGTVALQYFLSRNTALLVWQRDVSENGFYRTYYAYWGDPFTAVVDPVVPPNIPQPELGLPFEQGETWFFTGGAHGGWGSGSSWAALDFAPPDDRQDTLCYVSNYWVTAVAPGVIARSQDGSVVLDLDGDGDESTGWTILYLHIATTDRVQAGTMVRAGDRIGRASCEGGFSTATHMHIARRYNGEWIPAYCHVCAPDENRPVFVMAGWSAVGLRNQEYQGYLERNGERRIAEQGRLSPNNRVTWP